MMWKTASLTSQVKYAEQFNPQFNPQNLVCNVHSDTTSSTTDLVVCRLAAVRPLCTAIPAYAKSLLP